MNKPSKICTVWLGLVCLGSLSGPSHAAPGNDNWANRQQIAALPFNASLTAVDQATSEAFDPRLNCIYFDTPTAGANSVWYAFTSGATDEFISLSSSGYDTLLGVFEGSPANGLVAVRGGCSDDAVDNGDRSSAIHGLRLRANTEYSIVIARYPQNPFTTTTLTFNLQRSVVHQVTKTADSDDGVCDADCSLREAMLQAETRPGAVRVPAGIYLVPGGLWLGAHGGGLYGEGMDRTVIDAMGSGAVLKQAWNPWGATFSFHHLTLRNGNSLREGGALEARGNNTLNGVALRNSTTALEGGGVSLSGACNLSMYDSVVSGNRAGTNGGGIRAPCPSTEIYNSTISDNVANVSATGQGGGIYMYVGDGEAYLSNVTVAGNQALAQGGGVHARVSGSSRFEIINSSIVNNTDGQAAPSNERGGLVFQRPPTSTGGLVTIRNSVLAGNHVEGNPADRADCGLIGNAAPLSVLSGNNLVQAPGGCSFAAPSDRLGLDPLLLPLAPIDSVIPVLVPGIGSPLIDGVDPNDACASHDARHIQRPLDGDADGLARCDIGAVERQAGDEFVFVAGFE